MDGGLSVDVDGGGADAVHGASERRLYKLGGRLSINKQDDSGCMLVLDLGCDLSVQMCRKNCGRLRNVGCTGSRRVVRPTSGQAFRHNGIRSRREWKGKGHGPIIKAIISVATGKSGTVRDFYHMHYGPG